ncbi:MULTISPECIES: hypothetical protein [unclassified Leeuwenhoekiella]|uniref:hypothetical protein n=1 Tax=unclassified Leeuwenhoekiella TaxID=2615029 RepID=UPI000C546A3C|nr:MULTISPECIES: hypothetical protein [unclassified Leeuwenhoekiella]MAW97060.1 hypothetical protein [Leeuwenhoekiella sp.]MBA80659.1 hypothetical protein [Leeuwenhoekiella sp.]|tara:strand:- start:5556 stop:5963 length:408 start_codon:yes stop_codon:yes gene_type:complete
MFKLIEIGFQKFVVKRVFKKYRNSLPTTTAYDNLKPKYHILAGSLVWEDEGIAECHPKLGNAFRYVLRYRTYLISRELSDTKNTNKRNKQTFELAKKYFPNWVGFDKSRCTYNAELVDRLKRFQKVSEWNIDKIS